MGAARRYPDQDRSHQHGGQPRGAPTAARSPSARIRRHIARLDAAAARAGQEADEKGDGTLSARKWAVSPQDGLRDPDKHVVPRIAGRERAEAGGPREPPKTGRESFGDK